MKLKAIILFFLMIICSGCSIEYHLSIDERNIFSEEFYLKTENEEESLSLSQDPFPYKTFYDDPDAGDYPEKLDGVSYYATEILKNGMYYTKRFSYDFLANQFYRSNSVHTCYEKFNMSENAQDGTLTYRTSSKFLCMENFPNISSVTIRLESVKPIVVSNADEVQDNTYIWYINKNNYLERSLIFSIQNEEVSNHDEEYTEEKQEENSTLLAFLILALFFVVIGGIFFYNLRNQNQK